MTDATYNEQFYAEISDGSRRSAAAVVPLLLRLVPGVQSVVDFGCGSGTWLAEFSLCGVRKVLGLDFGQGTSEYLFIPREDFRVADLTREVSVARHDLAMSLEVAEHMSDSAARTFVRSIASAGDVVLFSAATPLQGGHNHVNERWPSYWIRLFAAHGLECHDVLRPLVWNDQRIAWWYRQNLLLFTKTDAPAAAALRGMDSFHGRDLIHPECFLNLARSVGAAPSPAVGAGGAVRTDAGQEELLPQVVRPRAGATRRVRRVLENVERAARRAGAALRGQSKEEFKKRWRLVVERRLVARSGLFDPRWYVTRYPDVAASGLRPLQHYLAIGAAEGRDPGPHFSSERYLGQYPWVAQTGIAPLVHFLQNHVETRAR